MFKIKLIKKKIHKNQSRENSEMFLKIDLSNLVFFDIKLWPVFYVQV